MKVFIVTKWYAYEGEEIIAVFDTQDKAEEYMAPKEAEAPDGLYYELHEWEVQ
jgi:hypothetical protein